MARSAKRPASSRASSFARSCRRRSGHHRDRPRPALPAAKRCSPRRRRPERSARPPRQRALMTPGRTPSFLNLRSLARRTASSRSPKRAPCGLEVASDLTASTTRSASETMSCCGPRDAELRCGRLRSLASLDRRGSHPSRLVESFASARPNAPCLRRSHLHANATASRATSAKPSCGCVVHQRVRDDRRTPVLESASASARPSRR